MNIITHLKSLKHLYLQSNALRTIANNFTFPSNFHLKLSLNPWECDCRIRWLRNALNRLEYPIYHDEPRCEMPKALADKQIVTLRDEQFVCGPMISKPDLTFLIATTGEVVTLRCDVGVKYFPTVERSHLSLSLYELGLFRSCTGSLVDISK